MAMNIIPTTGTSSVFVIEAVCTPTLTIWRFHTIFKTDKSGITVLAGKKASIVTILAQQLFVPKHQMRKITYLTTIITIGRRYECVNHWNPHFR